MIRGVSAAILLLVCGSICVSATHGYRSSSRRDSYDSGSGNNYGDSNYGDSNSGSGSYGKKSTGYKKSTTPYKQPTSYVKVPDWAAKGCDSKSQNDEVEKGCLKCVSILPNDNMDFGCFDWCAANTDDADDMEICTQCLKGGFVSKKYNPWACSQCISKADSTEEHSMCVKCLSQGVNDYYCAKALELCEDEDDLDDIYYCLAQAKNQNLKLEACLKKYKRKL